MSPSAAALGALLACLTTPTRAEGLLVEATGQFRLAAPEGYAQDPDLALKPPLLVWLSSRRPGLEAALSVERHSLEGGAVTLESFAKNLGGEPGSSPRATRRRFAGKAFEVYDRLKVVSLGDRLPPKDPWRDALGPSPPPPRLSLFESRRFPESGDAYRLYRCRKRGEWGLLDDYRRALGDGERFKEFRERWLDPRERAAVTACFGADVLRAMDRGEPVWAAPKPSLYRLRILARDEWGQGAYTRVEWESVHLRREGGVLYVLRYRAPERLFDSDYESFLKFVASFEPLGP